MHQRDRADAELIAWGRFIEHLGLDELIAKRLLFAWVRIRRAYFRD